MGNESRFLINEKNKLQESVPEQYTTLSGDSIQELVSLFNLLLEWKASLIENKSMEDKNE